MSSTLLGVYFPNVTHRKTLTFPFAKIITNNNDNNNYAISVFISPFAGLPFSLLVPYGFDNLSHTIGICVLGCSDIEPNFPYIDLEQAECAGK